MSNDPRKNAAQWFFQQVFQEEAITPRPAAPKEALPPLLQAARSLESYTPGNWQPREVTFVKQGKLLAGYEDDYVYDRPVHYYYPTYQFLSDRELRGYFSWRTKLRRGDLRIASLTYAFLYIYELINQIGVKDSMEGFEKLKSFSRDYGALDSSIHVYLRQWMIDYAVYYQLSASLLEDNSKVVFDNSLWVLDNIREQDTEAILSALSVLAPSWLKRSRFYREHKQDMDTVIVRVLRKVSEHYDRRCKKTMVERYFGSYDLVPVRPFANAVFYDRLKIRDCAYPVDKVRIYHCRNGVWMVQKYVCIEQPSTELGDLLKTIDAVMRAAFGYGHPIKCKPAAKWLLKLIETETQTLLDQHKAAEARKITIDYSQLAKIRSDAAVTQEKLIVDEEAPEEEAPLPTPEAEAPAPPPAAPAPQTPLDEPEYRLLRCLLYGGGLGWVRDEGRLLSVLVDSINEKLFDEFSDSVLTPDEPPEIIEDYIDDLKEMIQP